MRDEFIITRQGKQYVLYAGLLDAATARGLRSIDSDLIQIPDAENANVAIVKATCELEDGRKFSGIGDASPDNVGRNIAPHIIRMAETRAKARALRDAVNIGAMPFEELGDSQTDAQADAQADAQTEAPPASSQPTPIRRGGSRAAPTTAPSGDGASLPPKESQQAAQAAGADAGAKADAEAGAKKARKSQVDLLKTLAVEVAGEGGVERLEKRIEKPLKDLTRDEATEWIEKLTPEDSRAAT